MNESEFLRLLASTLMVDAAGNVLGFNFVVNAKITNCACLPYIDCDNNHLTPDEAVRNGFVLDTCGKLALKLVNCDGTYIK